MVDSTRIAFGTGSRRHHSRRALRPQHLGAALLTLLVVTPATSHAQTDYWNGSNDYWDVANDWSLGLPTLLFDVVNSTSGTITHRTGTDTINSFQNTSSGGFNLTGGTLTTTANFTNSGTGTLALSAGTLNVGGNFVNTGSGAVNVSGGALNVAGDFTNSGTGLLSISGGVTTVTGNFLSTGAMSLTGATLSGAGVGTSRLEVDNSFVLQNATLTNFSVKNSSAMQIQSATLSNLALDGGLTLNYYNSVVSIGDGVTFGTTTPTTVDNGSTLYFNGNNNPIFNTSLVFGGNGGSLRFDNLTLTLGSNALVHGAIGTIGSGNSDTLINQGTIVADIRGGSLSINSAHFTNNGLVEALNGGIALNGTTLLAGGKLVVGTGRTISATGSVTQTGGTTQVDGTLTTATDLQLQGGDLVGNGTIRGNLTNTGGMVRPGEVLGTLTVQGNYTQSGGGKLEIDLGGMQAGVTSDLLTVTGQALLGGELDVKVADGFQPVVGQTFDFLSYGSLSGGFGSLVSLNSGYGYTLSYDSADRLGTLTVVSVAAVPDTSTLFSASLMLASGGLLLRRRTAQNSDHRYKGFQRA